MGNIGTKPALSPWVASGGPERFPMPHVGLSPRLELLVDRGLVEEPGLEAAFEVVPSLATFGSREGQEEVISADAAAVLGRSRSTA